MKVALLPKKTRGQAARIVLRLNAGSESDLRGLVDAVALLPEMVQRGTRKHSYQQLRDELDRLRAEVRTGGPRGGGERRPGEATLSISTVSASVPAVLALLGEMVREPAFTPAEFETLKKEQITPGSRTRSSSRSRWRSLSWPSTRSRGPRTTCAITRRWPSGSSGTKAVKLEQLVAFHKAFWGAGDGQLALVGDFDAAAVKTAIAREFGTWKAEKPWKRLMTPYHAPRAADELVVTPDKQMATVGFAQPLALREGDPDFAALTLADYLFGSGFKSALIQRLRQKEGLSYGAGSS